MNGEPVNNVVQDAIVCMVTKAEHDRLTESKQTGWARYEDAGIKVFDAKTGQWL